MSRRSRVNWIDPNFIAGLAATSPRRVGILAYPGATAYEIGAAVEVLSTANNEARRRFGVTQDLYTVELIALQAGPLELEMGLKMLIDHAITDPVSDPYDTLLVSGACADPLEDALKNRPLIDWIRREARRARRVASFCTGAFLLAEAGIFTGSVATHWAWCDRLQERYPQLTVHADHIHVKQGNHYSSAGSTASMDLTLALLEEDVGRPMAMEVARRLVMFLRRAGGQSQFSHTLHAQSTSQGALGGVPEWIINHLKDDLSVEQLARRAAMSPRNFARVFLEETGLTPAKFVERARVERARLMVEESAQPLATIAAQTGFADERRMRRAFIRWLKTTPSDYLTRFRSDGKIFSFEAPERRTRRAVEAVA